jgi:hypothetical protein
MIKRKTKTVAPSRLPRPDADHGATPTEQITPSLKHHKHCEVDIYVCMYIDVTCGVST